MRMQGDGFSALFLCPDCGARTRVVDCRPRVSGVAYRRRECIAGHRFATFEMAGDAIGPALKAARAIERIRKEME